MRPVWSGHSGLVGDEELARTEPERQFLTALLVGRPQLMVWPRGDPDGTPWLCISRDFTIDNKIQRTLRLDFDGAKLRGGWSPGYLNWDDGVRAEDAQVDTAPPDGLAADEADPEQAAALAGRWFDAHENRWDGA